MDCCWNFGTFVLPLCYLSLNFRFWHLQTFLKQCHELIIVLINQLMDHNGKQHTGILCLMAIDGRLHTEHSFKGQSEITEKLHKKNLKKKYTNNYRITGNFCFF